MVIKIKSFKQFFLMGFKIVDIIESERICFAFLMDDILWLRIGFLSGLFEKLNSLNLS
jgi:hypothetical protein